MELARQHGLYSVAHPLRLDYTQLKKRLGGVETVSRKAAAPAFVELIASHAGPLSECVIEFEFSVGSKMRIEWKGSAAPDWISLLRLGGKRSEHLLHIAHVVGVGQYRRANR